MGRLERVINLLAALLDTERPLTRLDIQQRVPGYEGDSPATRRTFERDKQLLRDMGLPLLSVEVDPDHPEDGIGYRIPKDHYQLPDPGLTREESAALAVAATAVRLQSQSATAALWKLGATPDNPDFSKLASADVDLGGVASLSQMFTARRERRTVTFDYRGRIRNIDPHRLSFRNGHWYVSGHDHAKNEVRNYRLDRIEGQLGSSEPNAFAKPEPGVGTAAIPAPWQIGDGEPVEVQVLIDPSQAHIARMQSSVTIEQENADGSIVLSLQVVNRDALRSFVLGFLDHAEIVSPPDVRAEFVAYLEELVHA